MVPENLTDKQQEQHILVQQGHCAPRIILGAENVPVHGLLEINNFHQVHERLS
jgi:hypothetical protein